MTLKVTGAGSSWAVARRRLRLKLRAGGSCPKRVMTEWRACLRIHVERVTLTGGATRQSQLSRAGVVGQGNGATLSICFW